MAQSLFVVAALLSSPLSLAMNANGTCGKAVVKLEGFVDSVRQRALFTPDLIIELSRLADPQVEDFTIPDGLLNPGHEMRLYFTLGERRIRLTLRRYHDDGDCWSFGNTALDTKVANETGQGPTPNAVAYTVNEKRQTDTVHDESPGVELSSQLGIIRMKLLREAFQN